MSGVKKYRKLPVVIEAIQWTGDNTKEVSLFCVTQRLVAFSDGSFNYLVIPTLEGEHFAFIGDYIIKGIAEEFYPCKEDIFLKTYEEFNNECL